MKNKHIGTLLKKLLTIFLIAFLMMSSSLPIHAQEDVLDAPEEIDEVINEDNLKEQLENKEELQPLIEEEYPLPEEEVMIDEEEIEPLDLDENDISFFSLDEDPKKPTIPYDQTEVLFSKYYVNSSNVNDLNNKTFAIVFNDNQYYMEPSYKNGLIFNISNTTIFDGKYMTARKVNNYLGPIGLQTWTFEKVDDNQNNTYYIKCENSSYYLKIESPNHIYFSGGSSTDYGDKVRNRPNSLCLSLDKQVFYVDLATNGEIYLYNRELGFKASINNFWAKADSFVATTWPANSNVALYEAKPFGVIVDNENMKSSFNNTCMKYGIVRNENGSYSIGESFLPSIEEIDSNSNSYTLKKPGNFEPLTGYYVLTNEKEINQYGLSEERKMDIDARNGVINWNRSQGTNLNIDNYICPGNEYEFIDYVATDINGDLVHIPTDTIISWNNANLKAILPDGEEVELQYGQNIKATWKHISSLVTFHIDYTGTILDGDSDIERRTSSEKLTWAIAVGRIYNGKSIGNSVVMSNSIHKTIENEYFVPEYDKDNDNVQIKMELYASIPHAGSNTKNWESAKLYNANNMAEGALNYVHNTQSDVIVSLSPVSNGSTVLDKSNSNKDNYSIRWYAIKENNQSVVHINGVFVAKTSTFTITSNFIGLPDDKLDYLINHQYAIDTKVVTPDTISGNHYINLDVNTNSMYPTSIAKYEGNKVDNNSYTWIFKSLNGSNHRLDEMNFDVDGYDSVQTMTIDGEYYFTNPTIEGSASKTINFYNSYTPSKTGMFIVSNGTEDGHELTGARYELTDENGIKYTSTTNKNGMAIFNNLNPGTYTLEQVYVPNGYALNDGITWTIVVSKDENENTIVKALSSNSEDVNNDRELYRSENKTLLPLTVINRSNATTFVFEKKFGGEITYEQVESLFLNGYRIVLTDSHDNEIVLNNNENLKVSADGMTYTWTLTGIKEGEYVLKEENFDASYISTYAEISDVEGDNVDITFRDIYGVPEYVNYHMNILNGLSKLTSTTLYSKNIALEVDKVSSLDGSIKLEGAKFHLYTGTFSQASNDIPDGVDRRVSYFLNGQNKYAYYLKDITTGQDGKGIAQDLAYDSNYVLVEYEAPTGYALDPSPIVLESAKTNTISYYNGRLHTKVENTPGILKIQLTSANNNNVTKLSSSDFELNIVDDVTNNQIVLLDDNDVLDRLNNSGSFKSGFYEYYIVPNTIYQIEQINPPPGYALNEDNLYYVALLNEEDTNEYNNCLSLINKLNGLGIDVYQINSNQQILKFEIFNRLIDNYDLVVQLEDGNQKTGIIDVGFTLYKIDTENSPEAKELKTTSGTYNCVVAKEERLTSLNEKGEAVVKFENLKGDGEKYFLLQTKILTGYVKTDTAIEITVNTLQDDTASIIRDAKVKGIQTNMEGKELKIKIWNYSKLEMPSSGTDIVDCLILIMGTVLIALSLVLLLQEMQLRNRLNNNINNMRRR